MTKVLQKKLDGVKIYIPTKGSVDSQQSVAGQNFVTQDDNQVLGMNEEGRVNINSASVSELDGLWGIGKSRAQSIIESRPYSSIDELLSKNIIPSNVFERIKDEIVAY